MLVTSSQRITGLRFSYGCAALSRAYVGQLYLRIHWVSLHLRISSLKCSLQLLGLLEELLEYTRLLGAPPKVQPLFVISTYRIGELHFTYGNATLSAAYVGYLYFQNHGVHYTYGCVTLSLGCCCQLHLQNNWLTLHLCMRHLECSLCWLPLV